MGADAPKIVKPPKLSADASKALLQLNAFSPSENRELWLTIDELRQRLIFGGVHASLSTDMLQHALTHCNKGQPYMETRRDGAASTMFYRPSGLQDDSVTPVDQRHRLSGASARGLPILPPNRGYLESHSPKSGGKLSVVNDALAELAADLDEYRREQKKAEWRKRTPGDQARDDSPPGTTTGEESSRDGADFGSNGGESPSSAGDEAAATSRAASTPARGDATSNGVGPAQDKSIGEDIGGEDDADFGSGGGESPFIDGDEAAATSPSGSTSVLVGAASNIPLCECDFSDVADNEGNGIFNIPILTKFIHEATAHAAQCRTCLDLSQVNKRYGAGIIERWRCPNCYATLELRNCEWTRSGVIEPDRKYSRMQPSINLSIAAGARLNGINLTKARGLLAGTLGIKVANYKNVSHTENKVRVAIDELFKTRKEENARLHVEACKQQPDYEPIEFEFNGATHKATPGRVSSDGAGGKRCYHNNITSPTTVAERQVQRGETDPGQRHGPLVLHATTLLLCWQWP